ncbi:MAG TPA: hypothetical protein DER09_08805 [Prolixibacteraceae bacterium]|nr:hypothetical protein [Prolixibacteraceae bacterium]
MDARCAVFNHYPDKNDEVLEMWSPAKGDSLFSGMTTMIIIVLMPLIAFIMLRIITKTKSKRKKQSRIKRR